ncbi:MAG: queuosine precursor transporter [Bacteroidales bacterium]|nr:queuosine precursor transporter [Bacteroidales bacterium]
MNRKFTILAVLFCVCLVASNIFETKIFSAGPIVLTGGFLIFPISYIINDCITELYGFRNARFVILLGFAVNLFFVLTAQLVRILPPADFWDGQAHLDYLLSANLRITAASMAAFLSGSLLNAKVMAVMKNVQGKKGFGWRAILSTLVGETADSLVFFPIAFWGVGADNLLKMMLTQVLLKTLFEIIVLPFTYMVVRSR